MFLQRIFKWLTFIGIFAGSYFALPKIQIPLGGGKVFNLDQDVPHWAIGLVILIVLFLVFKFVTNIVLKILMIAAFAILLLVALAYMGVPVWQWISQFIN